MPGGVPEKVVGDGCDGDGNEKDAVGGCDGLLHDHGVDVGLVDSYVYGPGGEDMEPVEAQLAA